jgi:hypothetical protein
MLKPRTTQGFDLLSLSSTAFESGVYDWDLALHKNSDQSGIAAGIRESMDPGIELGFRLVQFNGSQHGSIGLQSVIALLSMG